MDDILFGNNNQATINRLAKRSYRANKQRNVFVTIALFLTAFMITSVFSLGCSYFETYQMQQIRAMGTTADVAITSLSEEQYEKLSRSSLVSVVGVSQRLGSIDTSGMDDALLSITWIDETEWQEHRVPTISDIHAASRWRSGTGMVTMRVQSVRRYSRCAPASDPRVMRPCQQSGRYVPAASVSGTASDRPATPGKR